MPELPVTSAKYVPEKTSAKCSLFMFKIVFAVISLVTGVVLSDIRKSVL